MKEALDEQAIKVIEVLGKRAKIKIQKEKNLPILKPILKWKSLNLLKEYFIIIDNLRGSFNFNFNFNFNFVDVDKVISITTLLPKTSIV